MDPVRFTDEQHEGAQAPEKTPLTSLLTQERKVGKLKALETVLNKLTPGERMLLYGLSVLLAASTLFLFVDLNKLVSVNVPARGGSLVEGALGTPRFINPLLAISQIDQDLTALTYSGLMRAKTDGDLVPDLASEYEISEDGTTYTFHIRPDATFHDGHAVTAEDVVFTVELAQNPDVKSPRRADWEGVSAHADGEKTVVFTLPHAYSPFLENTQLGILPKHLWSGVSIEEFPFHALNTNPIGSGPYEIHDIQTDNAGSPLSYEFASFEEFMLGQPNLDSITFVFFPNKDALLSGFQSDDIDSFAGINPGIAALEKRADSKVIRTASTRIFGIFFNQNHAPLLADISVRAALNAAIERQSLIDSVLGGFAKAADGPIPPGLLRSSDVASSTPTGATSSVERATAILSRNGWKFSDVSTTTPTAGWTKNKQVLTLTLATADTPELAQTAETVAGFWRELGVDVDVQVYPLAEFNSTVLRPRQYDAVLFGEVVGRTLDLFAFWHSSQRNDPGLNLALYTNTRADKLLASARTEIDRDEREELYRSFSELINEDRPAIFLYAPEFLYVVPHDLQGLSFGALTSPSERFLNVHEWYTDTERVWNIFSRTPDINL